MLKNLLAKTKPIKSKGRNFSHDSSIQSAAMLELPLLKQPHQTLLQFSAVSSCTDLMVPGAGLTLSPHSALGGREGNRTVFHRKLSNIEVSRQNVEETWG